jgi:hypothetical protein
LGQYFFPDFFPNFLNFVRCANVQYLDFAYRTLGEVAPVQFKRLRDRTVDERCTSSRLTGRSDHAFFMISTLQNSARTSHLPGSLVPKQKRIALRRFRIPATGPSDSSNWLSVYDCVVRKGCSTCEACALQYATKNGATIALYRFENLENSRANVCINFACR